MFGALSYTGDKVGDGAKALAAAGATAAPNFDEQQALVGTRCPGCRSPTADVKWLVGVNGTYVIKPPDADDQRRAPICPPRPAAPRSNTITLSDPPELTVDSNGYTLANTGALPANHRHPMGRGNGAGNWDNLYGQAGYYGFEVDRAPVAFTTSPPRAFPHPDRHSPATTISAPGMSRAPGS